jgi:hypothetical protein
MPDVALQLRPGIDVERTRLLNSAGWALSDGVRFFEGLCQKCGGWAHLNNQQLIGICTGMHAWADLANNLYIAAGTDQRLELFSGGTIYDITPLRLTTNGAPAFTTVIHTPTVTITDTGNGAAVGDWVNVIVPVSVGGLIIQGFYQVQTIVDVNNYTITAASNAASSVSGGGAVPSFTTINTNPSVTVALNAHGLIAGGVFYVQVSTAVGGFTLLGVYSIVTATTNAFTIKPGGNATSGATVSENSGNAEIEYLIHTGLQSTTVENDSGYGLGGYGSGPYGMSSSGTIIVPLREWSLDNFGQDLIGNYTGSPLYLWTPPAANNNPAIPINAANFPAGSEWPQAVNVSFVSNPQQMVICLGADDGTTNIYNPLLVRWCDIGNYAVWKPLSTNSAGSYPIPSGSQLVGGLSAPNFIVIWTDIDMWLMSYLGGQGATGAELVWGFNKVAGGSGLLSARSCGLFQNLVFFASSNGFYIFNGNSITQIPCPVWDKFWFNLNRAQVEKVNCQVNSWFGEVSWAFPSASGNGAVDSRVTYNVRENSWTYDSNPIWARTSWIDENVYGAPIGTDSSGYLQQHEVSNDADGSPLIVSAISGWFAVSEGSLFTMMERFFMDAIVTGGNQTVQITIYTQDYPTGPILTYGPYLWNPSTGPPYQIVRARARFMAFQIGSNGLGTFWRLGRLRYLAQTAGKHP